MRRMLLLAAVAVFAGPAAGDADAATTIGSDMGPPVTPGGSCANYPVAVPCTLSNESIPGRTLRAPSAGIVTRWRLKEASGEFRFRVLRPSAGDPDNTVTGAGTSEARSPSGTGEQTFDVRLAIKAGDRIAIDQVTTSSQFGIRGGATYDIWTPPVEDDGAPRIASVANSSGETVFNADIEPDQDGDGFGDETQDTCPGISGPKNGCPPATALTTTDTVAPSVLTLGFRHASFRAARKGGSTARKKRPVGTRVRYRVSEAGTAKFTIELAAKGRKKGHSCVKPTKKNRNAKRCSRYVTLKGSFSRSSKAGLNSFRFTGRLRGKKLRPGRYRLVMVASDAAKNKSKPRRAKFRVVLH